MLELIRDALKGVFKWVGPAGLVAVAALSIAVWLFYDFSEAHPRLTRQETVGMVVLAVLAVVTVKVLMAAAGRLLRRERKPVDPDDR